VTHVAILVPGIMGSELRLDGDVVWPGPASSFISGYKRMPDLLREDLVASDVIRSYLISRQYSSLIEDLATCGFHERGSPPTLFVFPYDWRKDNREAAAKLADLLDRVVPGDGVSEVSVVAHSMGGLVSRYYLESGRFARRRGFKAVRRLITLGTPHRGAPLALTAALGLEKRLFLSQDQVLLIARDPRYPALYQLLPPPDEPFAWDEDPSASFMQLDIYGKALAGALGLVPENLEAVREFRKSLNPAKRPSHVRYFSFTGTRQTTATAVWLRKMGGKYRSRKLEPDDAGDGTVPSWSAALNGIQGQPVGGEHGTIYRNRELRRTLAGLLGAPGVLAVEEDGVEVALRERVSEPAKPVRVSLSFAHAVSHVEGELRLLRVTLDETGAVVSSVQFGSFPIRYTGLGAETIGLTFNAPNVLGVYRVGYFPAGSDQPAGEDELFVQERVRSGADEVIGSSPPG
jgi:phospholipase A1